MRTLEDIKAEMNMVAEGVKTAVSVHELAKKFDVEMPISEAVYAILFKGMAPRAAVHHVMTRSAKHEHRLVDSDD